MKAHDWLIAWVIGWMFSLGYMNFLDFGGFLLSIVAWPFMLGVELRVYR
jgi:hypothetical protein